MKKILLFLLTITTLPIVSGYNCRSNQGDPDKPDYKIRHAIKCYCNCSNRNNSCPECGHSQEPRPLVFIKATKEALQQVNNSPIVTPKDFETYVRNFKNKKE